MLVDNSSYLDRFSECTLDTILLVVFFFVVAVIECRLTGTVATAKGLAFTIVCPSILEEISTALTAFASENLVLFISAYCFICNINVLTLN